MELQISAVLLFAIIVFILIRQKRLSWGGMLASFLLGFLVASTQMAPAIESAVNSIAQALNNVDLE